jgi:hypothetical protein
MTVVMKILPSRLHTAFLIGLFLHPEDEGDLLLRNVGSISTNYTALYAREQNSSNVNFLPDFSTLRREGKQEEYRVMEYSLLEYLLFSVHIIVFCAVLPGICLRRKTFLSQNVKLTVDKRCAEYLMNC